MNETFWEQLQSRLEKLGAFDVWRILSAASVFLAALALLLSAFAFSDSRSRNVDLREFAEGNRGLIERQEKIEQGQSRVDVAICVGDNRQNKTLLKIGRVSARVFRYFSHVRSGTPSRFLRRAANELREPLRRLYHVDCTAIPDG